MSYRLTKIQLESSVYYCGAGIDFQPILRFGDVIENFIYVTAGLTKDEFLNGIDDFIVNTQEELIRNESSLIKTSTSDILIKDIEHPMSSRSILGKPDYFTPDEYDNYLRSIRQFIDNENEFHLEICFTLKIGNIKKIIRLFHLSGEALATYDIIYRKQQIAPKVFISIQTGLIEIPNRFSNSLFELSSSKPKIWLRGVWEKDEYSDIFHPEVFRPNGIYNEQVGEYRNWKIDITENKTNTTNREKPIRIVKAYGQSADWINTNSYSIHKSGLTINKLLRSYNGTMAEDYDLVKLHFPLSKIFEILNEIRDLQKTKNKGEKIRVAILPGGFECFELVLNDFAQTYNQYEIHEIEFDIFYVNKSDMRRDF